LRQKLHSLSLSDPDPANACDSNQMHIQHNEKKNHPYLEYGCRHAVGVGFLTPPSQNEVFHGSCLQKIRFQREQLIAQVKFFRTKLLFFFLESAVDPHPKEF